MSKYTTIFDSFTKLKALVIGDAMVDRYLSGSTNRISPEAPVPVVLLEKEEDRLGGAANVALNLKALGAIPYITTVVGNDIAAISFDNLMQAEGLPVIGVVHSDHRHTTMKTRILSRHQQLLRLDQESITELFPNEEQQLLERCRNLMNKGEINVVIFQDYNKGVLTPYVIHEIISLANYNKIPVAVDPKYKNFFEFQHVSLFKPNLAEVKAIVPFDVFANDKSTLRKAARFIRERLQNYYTLITLSDKGIYLDTPEKGMIIPTKKRNVADVSGAGDTVLSLVALGLAAGLDMEKMVQLANLAGGIVCEEVGVVPINKEQLIREATL